ncbi:hypothetical protein KGF57_001563 [Candida theae]|uniref:Uncharacterized protein n=1 Tax=Candida theae TaxID=1198502 RepID=A0AAD5BHC8_9ASCO|nr:uncharacterized protein KGF57_001563 [Candida theae]KAI5961935.1 hypothetical protein KGF57_001563 [Candida theae]
MARNGRRLTLHEIYSDDVPPLADSTWQQLPKVKQKSKRKPKAMHPKNGTTVCRGRLIQTIEEPLNSVEEAPLVDTHAAIEAPYGVSTPGLSNNNPVTSSHPTRLPTIRTLLNKVRDASITTTAQNVFDMCTFYNKPHSLVSDLGRPNAVQDDQQNNMSEGNMDNSPVSYHLDLQSAQPPSGNLQKVAINFLLNDELERPNIQPYPDVQDVSDFEETNPNGTQQSYDAAEVEDGVTSHDTRNKLNSSRSKTRRQYSMTVFDAMDLLHCEKPIYKY